MMNMDEKNSQQNTCKFNSTALLKDDTPQSSGFILRMQEWFIGNNMDGIKDLMLLSERSVTEGPTQHESNYRTI